jgi:hypothetical protein
LTNLAGGTIQRLFGRSNSTSGHPRPAPAGAGEQPQPEHLLPWVTDGRWLSRTLDFVVAELARLLGAADQVRHSIRSHGDVSSS